MRAVALVLIVGVCGGSLIAQTPRFTAGTAAVRVDVLVTHRNRPLTGLTVSDFELRDNGVLQRITDVSRETLPLNLICVFDVSGSVEGAPLAHLKDAMLAVIDALADRDRAALITFTWRVQLHSPLTSDRQRLRELVAEVKAGGATAVIDAAFAGLALREADEGRTLMLLFSDGRDTVSWFSARAVLDAARRTDVVVYPVTLEDRFGPIFNRPLPSVIERQRSDEIGWIHAGERLLEAFADETGGRVVHADGERDLRSTFIAVLSEFRQRYVLSYTPTGVSDDSWHAIDVRLKGRSGQVKARRGYLATPITGAASKAPRR
jgi:Ca-activated chloride channel homolog